MILDSLSEISEILQICLILFITAMFFSFVLTNIFTLIDEQIAVIENKDTKNFCIILVTFIQLFITTIFYFYIESFLHKIRLWKHIIKSMYSNRKKYKLSIADLKAFSFASHIVLIIVLIDMNKSLKKNFEHISDILVVK